MQTHKGNHKVFSVSEFVELVNNQLELLDGAIVEGEVSGLGIFRAKWAFFSIKDEASVVECMIGLWRLDFPLEDGMLVKVYGSPAIYPRSGRFRLKAEYVELSGEGSLKRAFELTRRQLEAEGLFDPSRKRPLPEFPGRIGVITSVGSAAYSDFVKIANERFKGFTLFVHDVRVQGEGAIEEIVSAFQHFNRHGQRLKLDMVTLLRGGGSLEDLQAFNSEAVARAVFGSRVPVVCGVGHEKDESLADWAADVRASTPSNAAELIFRHHREVALEIDSFTIFIKQAVKDQIDEFKERLDDFRQAGLHVLADERRLLEKLTSLLRSYLALSESQIKQNKQNLARLVGQMDFSFGRFYQDRRQQLEEQLKLLNTLSPQATLKRGFSLVQKNGTVIKKTSQLELGDDIEVLLSQGRLRSRIYKLNS